MNITKSATMEGDKSMNSKPQTTIKESKMKITASNLIRWAGLAAMAAGIIFAAIQPIHPADVLASVTTSAWAIITPLKMIMCLLFLLGITGIYARQVKKAGWLGLVGFLLFSLCLGVRTGLYLRRSLYHAAVGDRGADVCRGLLGDRQWAPQSRSNLGALPALYALLSGPVYVRRPAVWHRYVPRRHPAALGGWSACRRVRVDAPGCGAPAQPPAVCGGAGGVSSGLAGICTLVRTARASLGTCVRQGKPAAPPNRSRVRSLETA